ncbi:hypothetical protein FB451DRAFT_1284360 [Mycena latifolia]|nr:hypothetical protein FB451DRAFT_1284360 [Mycena latifolia]
MRSRIQGALPMLLVRCAGYPSDPFESIVHAIMQPPSYSGLASSEIPKSGIADELESIVWNTSLPSSPLWLSLVSTARAFSWTGAATEANKKAQKT